MSKAIQRNYRQFRGKGGMGARKAVRAARILAKWEELGEGCVRMRAEAEEESYMDSYGEPEGYVDGNGRRVSVAQARKELVELIERDGCWRTVSEYFDGQEWQHADSCGMHTGYKDVLSPFENWYVVDEMEVLCRRYGAQTAVWGCWG